MVVFKQHPQGCEKGLKISDFANFQCHISFFLKVARKHQLYEKVYTFYELFENVNHLSRLLNQLSDFGVWKIDVQLTMTHMVIDLLIFKYQNHLIN